jgi:hypothetical protein
LKEYEVQDEPITIKYKSPCAVWYRKKHIAAMDDQHFDLPKPVKDWDERLERT